LIKRILIRVRAEGAVKFGPHSSTDAAVAGVGGNGFFKWLQGTFGGEWEQKIANPRQYPDIVRNALGTSGPVNYDQGGVWVKFVKKSGEVMSPPNLYLGKAFKFLPKHMTAEGMQRIQGYKTTEITRERISSGWSSQSQSGYPIPYLDFRVIRRRFCFGG